MIGTKIGTLTLLGLLPALPACGPRPKAVTGAQAAAQPVAEKPQCTEEEARDAGEARVLPAGAFYCPYAYYVGHPDEYWPEAAVVAGVYETLEGAEAGMNALYGKLQAGYPWVVKTSLFGQVDLLGPGYMIVAAQFRTEAEAVAWQKCHPLSDRMRVVKRLATPWNECPQSQVVQLDRPRPTRAYRGDDVEQAIEAVREAVDGWYGSEDYERTLEAELEQLTPACTFAPRSLAPSTTDATQGDDHWFEWAFWPVECDGKTAWVWSKHTRINAVVTIESDGAAYFHQIMDVTCDQSTVISWRWQEGDAVGKGVERGDTGGCAD